MLIAASIVIAAALSAHPSQRELDGFFLGQREAAVTNTFDKPFDTQKDGDGNTAKLYTLDSKKNAYMVFTYAQDEPDVIIAVQLTGDAGTEMMPFLGLKLGDSRDSVDKALGKASHEEPIPDIPGTLLSYDDRNYTVEINPKGQLSSIRIAGYDGFPAPTGQEKPDFDAFLKALHDKNGEALLDIMHPDAVIYRGDKNFLAFAAPERVDLTYDISPFYKSLFTDKDSVSSIFDNERSTPEENVRLTDDKNILIAYKYPSSKTIQEVVYKWEAGQWRVWEIRLR